MDFTREPIIETVITPREGYRLVVRSSKNASQEEHFVDALEVVSFGNALFFRCLERPKPFIVPSADYEILEVREPRIVLKTPVQEKAAAPREQLHRVKAEIEKKEMVSIPAEREESSEVEERSAPAVVAESQNDRRRERRRPFRRRRGQNREEVSSEVAPVIEGEGKQNFSEVPRSKEEQMRDLSAQKLMTTTPMLSSILPPPTTLIRDDLARLREQEPYKGAFFIREDKESLSDDDDDDDTVLEGLRSDEFVEETEGRDQEVSPEEPFCDPFFEEKISETIPQDDHKSKEDVGTLDF